MVSGIHLVGRKVGAPFAACRLLNANATTAEQALIRQESARSTPDIGELGPTQCDRVWRTLAAENGSWLPGTAVRIVEATGEAGDCGTYLLKRWVFASVSTYDCL